MQNNNKKLYCLYILVSDCAPFSYIMFVVCKKKKKKKEGKKCTVHVQMDNLAVGDKLKY